MSRPICLEQCPGAARSACGLLLAFLLCSCHEQQKECQEFIGTVNRTLREIDARPQPKADDLKAVMKHRRALADEYRALAKDVHQLELTEPELASRAERYSKLATGASETLLRGVKALDDQDSKAAQASQREFEGIAKREATLVREINQLCLGDS